MIPAQVGTGNSIVALQAVDLGTILSQCNSLQTKMCANYFTYTF